MARGAHCLGLSLLLSSKDNMAERGVRDDDTGHPAAASAQALLAQFGDPTQLSLVEARAEHVDAWWRAAFRMVFFHVMASCP